MSAATPRTPIAAIGVVCLRGEDVLLVRRANPPRQGQWSLPGGRLEWGERALDAAMRELQEETGCAAEPLGLIGVFDALPGAEGEAHYVLIDYAARWLAGEPRPGDDALAARFFAPSELNGLALWPDTARAIEAGRAMAQR